jgi:hypothetical protein
VAASLRNNASVEVEVIDGSRGEFTVLADGREVIRKGVSLPTSAAVQSAIAGGLAVAAATAGE